MPATSRDHTGASTVPSSRRTRSCCLGPTGGLAVGMKDSKTVGAVARCAVCGANYRTAADVREVRLGVCPNCLAAAPQLGFLV